MAENDLKRTPKLSTAQIIQVEAPESYLLNCKDLSGRAYEELPVNQGHTDTGVFPSIQNHPSPQDMSSEELRAFLKNRAVSS